MKKESKFTMKSVIIFTTVCFIIIVAVVILAFIDDSKKDVNQYGIYVSENTNSTITIELIKDKKCKYTFLANSSSAVPSTTEYCNYEIKDKKVYLTAKFKYAEEFTNVYTIATYAGYMIQEPNGNYFDKISN